MLHTTLPRGSLGLTSSRQNGHMADCSLPRCTFLRRPKSVFLRLAGLLSFDVTPVLIDETLIEEPAAGAEAAAARAPARRRPWPVVWRAVRADACPRDPRDWLRPWPRACADCRLPE